MSAKDFDEANKIGGRSEEDNDRCYCSTLLMAKGGQLVRFKCPKDRLEPTPADYPPAFCCRCNHKEPLTNGFCNTCDDYHCTCPKCGEWSDVEGKCDSCGNEWQVWIS